MLFNSFEFLLFLPVAFLLYWLLQRSVRWQNLFVVAASYLFYGWWDWRFLLLIAFTSLCSYCSGRRIAVLDHRRARRVMWANVAVNLGVLGVFKYYDFFMQSFANLFLAGNADGLLLRVLLPVGISFYTFQALSYSIDVYQHRLPATRDVVAFFAYVSFFPQLVAGPIERATTLLPQFERPRSFNYAMAVDGMRQMLWGFFKKMVVADSCAVYVDMVFAHPADYNGASLLVGAVLFTIQIYGDFSGYSDIAVGCSKLFGITLRRNFNVPYFSRDIAEFWRRWHISLTTWFRDYVYIPIGGSRVPKGRIVLNTFVIFLLSGLWHGANWTFVAWGAYHALLFLPLILLGRNRRHTDVVAATRTLPSFKELLQMVCTFVLAMVGWVFFRSESVADAVAYLSGIVTQGLWAVPVITHPRDCVVIVVSVVLMTLVEWHNRTEHHEFARQSPCRVLRWGFYILLIFLIGAFMQTNEMPFIYFQF